MIDKAHGEVLTKRLRGVRQSLSESMGMVLPPINVRDDLGLKPSQYAVVLGGATIAQSEVYADRLMAITPEGDALTLFEDGDPAAVAALEAEFASGRAVQFDTMMAAHGRLAPWMASVTFGGPDLGTVFLGSLRGTTIPAFASPVPGLPMVHWPGPRRR